MKEIFRILFCFLLIFHAGIVESYAQCGSPNTLEFQGVDKIYNTACGNTSYQDVVEATPSGSGNIYSWQVSFGGGAFTDVKIGGVPISTKKLAKDDITDYILAPAGNASGDYRIRRIVTNIALGCSNNSQPVFLYYSRNSTTISGGIITGTPIVCTPATGTLTVSSNTGPVLQWESAPSNGGPWTPIANTTTNTLTYSGLTSARCYRARIDNICNGAAGAIDATDPYSTIFCITVNSVPAITAQPLNRGICIGSSLNLSVTATSASTMSYQWRKNGFDINGAVSASYNIGSVSNFDAGSYDVVITNACGSVTSTAAVVTVNPQPIANVPSNIVVCPGGSVPNTAFSSSPAGATYTWTNSNTTIGLAASGSGNVPSFTATNAGTTAITATITVTPILNGCAGFPSSYTITVSPRAVVAVPANFSVCSGALISATNFVGTPSGTTFTWTNSNTAIGLAASGNGNVPGFTAISSGTATITVTPTFNGCTGTPSSYNITVNPLLIISATATNELTCGGNNGTITVTASGTGPFTYTIVKGATSQSNSTGNFGPLAPGSYSVLVSNSTGCISRDIVTISSPGAPPKPDINTSNSPVCEGADIIVTVLNPISGATYTWTGPGFSFTGTSGTLTRTNADVSMAGDYVVTATSAGGCVSLAKEFTIEVKRRPVINIPQNLVFCPGISVPAADFISTPAGASYTWTNSNTGIGLLASGSVQIPTFTAVNTTNSPLTATITITPSLNGCTGDPVSYTITINPTPIVVSKPAMAVCHGSTIPSQTFSSNVSGATFTWTVTALGATFSGPGSIPAFLAVNNGVTPIVGTVTVTASSNGCSGPVMNYNITVNPLPRVTNAPLNQATCGGTSTTVVALTSDVAGATYSWSAVSSPGITGFTPSGTGNIPSELITNSGTVPGTVTYTIIATANGCPGPATTYVVTVDPAPKLLSSISLTQTVCTGRASTAVNLSSEVTGTKFNWTATASGSISGFQSTGTNQTQIPSQTLFNSGTSPGTVTYTIVPISDGCSGPVSVYTITVNPLPTATISGNATVCYGATTMLNVTLTGTAPWTITYTDGTSFFTVAGIMTSSYSLAVKATSTKTYSIAAVSDAAACSNFGVGNATITLLSEPISINFIKNNVNCFGESNGFINLAVSGGKAPYVYSWDNGRNTKDITNLMPGTYTISITDANGCSETKQIVINQPAQPLSVNVGKTNVNCFSANNGIITLNVSGGAAPYTYNWSSGQITSSLSGVGPGLYSVTIVDANGCLIRETVSVIQPSAPLRMSFTIKNTVCKSSSDGMVTAAITGGTSPYTILWNGRSQTSNVLTGLAAGSYDITVKDATGCTFMSSAQVVAGVCPPVAVDDIFKIYEGSFAKGSTALNDFDREKEKLSFSISAQAKNGTIVFNSDGSFTYTPNPGFLGTETVPYRICNTSGVCSTADLLIRVVPFSTVNLTPTISNVREGKKVTVTATLERVFPDDVTIKIGYSGNAIKDRDYVLLDQFIQIMIPKGQLTTTQKITIAALTDDINEGDENVIIQILSTSDPEVKIGTSAVVIIGDVYPPEPVEIEKKDAPINPDITIDPLFSPNNDGAGNDVFNIVNIVSFPDNEVIIFNRWGNEVFRLKGYNESDRVFKGYANKGLLSNTNTPLVDGVYYYLITTRRTINGSPVTAVNKGYLILKR